MPIDTDVQEMLDYIGARPVVSAANSTLDELRLDKEEIESRYDLTELSMYRELSQDIPGPNGSVPVRIYWSRRLQENERLPVLIFIHGGAWVFCSMDTHENMLRYLCMKGDVIGINIGYHLAPEHKFPAAIEDCYAVLEWTQKNIGLPGVNPDKICVAGDSAGGNIAAVLCLLARDRQGPDIAAQLLFYPSVAAGVLPRFPSWHRHTQGYQEEFEQDINILLDYYLNSPEELSDYRVSPILADYHSNLPPALIITAEYDPFCDDGFNYADKLKSSGVDVDYKCFEGVVHAFMSLAGGMSRGYEALDYTAEYLNRVNTCR